MELFADLKASLIPTACWCYPFTACSFSSVEIEVAIEPWSAIAGPRLL